MEEENARLRAEVQELRKRLQQLEEQGSSNRGDGNGDTGPHAATAGAAAAAAAAAAAPPPPLFLAPHGFTKQQAERYSRQLLLPAFGAAAQARLSNGAALIVGCGGLGAPAALYLAAAGIGRLGLVDHDLVEISNLHRQIIHTEARAGTHKARSAAAAVGALNSLVALEVYTEGLCRDNAASIVAGERYGRYNVVIDASDNAPTRYLLSDACAAAGVPLVSAAAVGTDGQLTVYCMGEDGPCYRCLFPEPPAPGNCARCADAGVLGPVPGVMGVLQALEAVKIISGVGRPLSRQLLLFDGLAGRFTTVRLRARAPDCFACGGSSSGSAETGTSACEEASAASATAEQGGGEGPAGSRSRGRLQLSDLATFDYAAFTGQSAHDGAPPPLRVLPPEARLRAPEFRQHLEQAGLLPRDVKAGGGSATNGTSGRGAAGHAAAAEEAAAAAAVAADCVLLDVRPKAQFEVMALPGAVNVPFDSIERFRERGVPQLLQLCGAVSPDAQDSSDQQQQQHQVEEGQRRVRQRRPVYVLCRRGNHSQLAVQELRAAGLSDAFDLVGGMEAWAAEVDPTMPVL